MLMNWSDWTKTRLYSLYTIIIQIEPVDMGSVTRSRQRVAKTADDEYILLFGCMVFEISGSVVVGCWKDFERITS